MMLVVAVLTSPYNITSAGGRFLTAASFTGSDSIRLLARGLLRRASFDFCLEADLVGGRLLLSSHVLDCWHVQRKVRGLKMKIEQIVLILIQL